MSGVKVLFSGTTIAVLLASLAAGGAVMATDGVDASIGAGAAAQDPPTGLDERLRALEALVMGLFDPAPVQEPCSAGVGCAKVPFVVDESGDVMYGALNMDRAAINFIAEGALDFANLSYINGTDSVLRMPVDLLNQVNILDELTIREGATLSFENNTSFIFRGSASRIGTEDATPFFIVVNNTTALAIFPPGPSGEAANFVMGFDGNSVTSLSGSSILGGGSLDAPNLIEGVYNTILGGTGNSIIGDSSVVGGSNAAALNDGTFVWADATGAPFASTADNQFLIRALGGVGIGTASPVSTLTVEGNITPATNDKWALGSPTNRWDVLYMASTIDFANDLLYTSGGTTLMRVGIDGTVEVPGTLDVGAITSSTPLSGLVLENGSVTEPKLADESVTLAKIAHACDPGQILKSSPNGWVCANDFGGQNFQAGDGLSVQGEVISADTAVLQVRVHGACAEGAISGVNADGSVRCATDALQTLSCTTNDVIRWDGSAWVCSREAALPGAGALVQPLDGDRDESLTYLGSSSLCFVDDNTNNRLDPSEGLYLRPADAACGPSPTIAVKDLRLTASHGHAAFTRVETGDTDVGAPALLYVRGAARTGISYLDVQGDGLFNRGDALYADRDGSRSVTAGDYRWTDFGAIPAGSAVAPIDPDVGRTLAETGRNLNGAAACWDLDSDGKATTGDILYLDTDGSGDVSRNDARLGDLATI